MHFGLNGARWTPRNYDQLALEAYVRNVIAYRCIRLKADAVSSLPWIVKSFGVNDPESLMLKLLNRPNPTQTGIELFDDIVMFLEIAGNSYIEQVSIQGKKPQELYVLRPDRLKLIIKNGREHSYEYSAGGQKKQFLIKQTGSQQLINHIKYRHPINDSYGLSAVDPCSYSVDIHAASSHHAKALLDNGARPSGALVFSGTDDNKNLADDQFTKLKKEITEQYSGAENSGKPLLLDGGLSWVNMGLSPMELDFMEGKNQAAREIALAFGVPPMLLGLPGDNTFSNYAEANRAFFRQTILPLATRVSESVTQFLAPSYPGQVLAFDQDLVPALVQERESLWKKVKGATWITVDEARAATGYDPHPDPEIGKLPNIAKVDDRGDRGEDDGQRKQAETGKD